MIELNAIFAHGLNGEFSLQDGSLPWKNIPELLEDAKKDMEHFKNTTTGHIVIMGFNTYKTFNKPLSERINVVIDRNSRNETEIKMNEFNFFDSLEAALAFFSDEKFSSQKKFLIGGAKILEHAFERDFINGKLFETVFDYTFPAASSFINPVSEEWNISDRMKNAQHSEILIRSKLP